MARHSFQPQLQFFLASSCTSPYFGRFFGKSFPLFPPHSPFLHSVKAFSFRASSFFTPCSTFIFPLLSFPLLIHPTLFAPSPAFFLFPPHFSIFLPNNYARTRTPALTRTSGGFRLLPSPLHPHRNPLCTNTLGVKQNEKKPSQNAQQPHNQNISTKHPISSAVNFI